MAVDLAKLSLWLTTMAKDHPFTFVDHAIKCGDSLVGLSNKQIAAFHWDPPKKQILVFGEGTIEKTITRVSEARKRILEFPEDTEAAVVKKREFLAAADDAAESIRNTGDLVIAVGADPVDPEEPTQELADPSNYAVDGRKHIEVQATETLGHYAEWLDLRASRLRRINGLSFGTPISVGETLELDFSSTTPEEFERKRVMYHRDIQETFFEQYEISGTHEYKTRRGDSLWSLSLREFKVPVWLVLQYNPDIDFSALQPGTKLSVPEIRRHGLATDTAAAGPPAGTLQARR